MFFEDDRDKVCNSSENMSRKNRLVLGEYGNTRRKYKGDCDQLPSKKNFCSSSRTVLLHPRFQIFTRFLHPKVWSWSPKFPELVKKIIFCNA